MTGARNPSGGPCGVKRAVGRCVLRNTRMRQRPRRVRLPRTGDPRGRDPCQPFQPFRDHHLRRHRRDPHADDDARTCRSRRTQIAEAGDRRGRGRRGDPPPARARSERRAADARSRRCSWSSCRGSRQATDAVINITTGGGHEHDGARSGWRRRCACQPEMCSLNMGSMNFGLYPHAEPLPDVQVRVGAGLPRRQPRLHLPQHLQGHRVHPRARSAGAAARASSSSATTSATSTTWRTSSTASWSSRRSSCRRSSASSAASAPTPRTCCT